MTIPVYSYGLTVTLIKIVARKDGVSERYSGADRILDLTPYLGEAGSVRTMKSLGEPAGAFEISFGDRIDPNSGDSIYGKAEPMDLIEIRAARRQEDFSGQPLPIILRGFIDAVRRSETIGDDGEPRRTVVITGHDFGKIAAIHQVMWEQALNQEKPLLTTYGLQAVLGLTPELLGVAAFMGTFVEKVLNAKVDQLATFSQQIIKHFIFDDGGVQEGQVLPGVFGRVMAGTYWQIMSGFADRPWNELFIRDEEDGPHVVFREAPYKGIDGKLIMPYATDPGTVELTDKELVQLDVERSDARVGNFFWTPPGTSSLDTQQYAVAGSIIDGSALDFQHGNNRPELYGERRAESPTSLIPTEAGGVFTQLPANEQKTEGIKYVEWYRLRAQQLQAMNRDNVIFEDGQMVAMGREDYSIGRYIRLYRGELTSESYVTGVSHVFQPMNGWTTTLRFERGTGFLERGKLQKSPFYLEGRSGPYSS